MMRVNLDTQTRVKTVVDFMVLCLVYDMSFTFNTPDNVMYIEYKAKDDGEYAQVFFDSESGCLQEAYMQMDGEILGFSSTQRFYEILECARKGVLQRVYWDFGLIEHPSTRFKRRGDYQKVIECLRLVSTKQCNIDYFDNIIRIVTLRENKVTLYDDRLICNIAIAIQRGQYKMGVLRRRGITIDVPDVKAMQRILEGI